MQLIYEGTDIWGDVSVNRIYHDMYAEKHADTLIIKFNDVRKVWDGWAPAPDDSIAVIDRAAKTGAMFVESMTPEDGAYILRATSIPQTAKNNTTKSWEKVKLIQLAQEIAGRHGLTFASYGVGDLLYEYVAQENVPDLAFLQQRCALEGAAFLVYDGKLVLYDEAYMESQTPLETLTIAPSGRYELSDNAASGYGSARVQNGGFSGTFAAGNGLAKEFGRVLSIPIGSQAEADRFAKGILRDVNKDAKVGTFWASGLLRQYAAGSTVALSICGASSWDGPVFITSMRHDYTKKNSKITFRKPLEGY